MCSDILISLHPRHCDNLVSGRKTVELRRRKMAVRPGTRVWIYSTRPRACVEAYAIVQDVVSGSHDELWNAYSDKVAVSRCEFDHYFAGTADAHAIVLREVATLKPSIKLKELRRRLAGFHPPQFFKRLAPSCSELFVLSERTGES